MEVEIVTPRGVHLAGTFEPSTGDAAVLFAHSFLADRHGGMVFDILASAYRTAGYATLQIDFSGCGASDDDVITVDREVEDLLSASAWLTEQGYADQAIHAHAFGSLAALRASPARVRTMVLAAALTGPLNYPWEEIFAPEQLDELDRLGVARIPDDNDAGDREYSVISRQTLADISLVDQRELLSHVHVPVLLVHSGGDDGEADHISLSRDALPLLPAGSRMEVLPSVTVDAMDGIDDVAALCVAWLGEHLPG